jgi:molecular chaperone DnaK
MDRMTIDYGIDLGTTNSEIARLRSTKPEIIHNGDGAVMTPSAVYIDKKGQLYVGRKAKEICEANPDNCEIQFKLRMGLGDAGKKRFMSSNRTMLPEEMSAEVLKSLRADVFLECHEQINSAVITVPADFDRPATEATVRAGRLAGFTTVRLLQEPVAASLAYGFQDDSDKEFWLVYDFGGGTFDAAIMQVRDGLIQVINHAGDNELGGKCIDWDIVNKKLIPELTRKYKLTDFRPGVKWHGAIARLKDMAEEMKIRVSRSWKPENIFIDTPALGVDENGKEVEADFTLTPDELAEIVTPYVIRSVNLCQKALSEKGLSANNIQKVLMVGGTSLIRSLQLQLKNTLGIPLDFSIDPMTVVAQGAAIFAGTQKCTDVDVKVPAGAFTVDLQYEPVGSDTETPVAGKVRPPQGISLAGYTIEVMETKSKWRSGKIRLGIEGTFMTEILSEKGRRCEFEIILCDSQGSGVTLVPNRLSYTVGMVITGMPLQHSIGVWMVNDETNFLLTKGRTLPAQEKVVHRTVEEMRKGQDGKGLRIPLVEGENRRADRNRQIGEIFVPSVNFRRDLPAGSEVEITIRLDSSGVLSAKAFVPVLDEDKEFEAIIRMEDLVPDPGKLRVNFERQCERLESVREKAKKTNNLKSQEVLSRVEDEQIVEQVRPLLEASESGESDEKKPCLHRILDLTAAIDQVEDALEWPVLVEEAKAVLIDTQKTVEEHGEPSEKTGLRTLEAETKKAIDSGQTDVLRQRVDDVKALGYRIVWRQPGFWVGYLDYLEVRKSNMRDLTTAAQLFTQGRKAINNNDIEALQAAVRQLIGLLPKDDQEEARGYGGTTILF